MTMISASGAAITMRRSHAAALVRLGFVEPFGGFGARILGDGEAVADRAHRLDQRLRVDGIEDRRIEGDGGSVGGQVDRRVDDACLSTQAVLNPGRAGAAGHPGDIEVTRDGLEAADPRRRRRDPRAGHDRTRRAIAAVASASLASPSVPSVSTASRTQCPR